MNKKTKKILLIMIGIIALMLIVRFMFGGPEDTWICSAGKWIKHGSPISSMPTGECNWLDNLVTKNLYPQ